MTPRSLSLAVVLPLLLAAMLVACDGGGGRPEGPQGQLSDPGSAPTATAWVEPPEVIILNPEDLTAGPSETASPTPGAGTPTTQECGDTYTVQAGDYPGLIAEKCDVSVQDLLEANPTIEPTNLHIGDKLIIPR